MKQAREKWKEHETKIKKKKEEETLDLQENKHKPDEEKDTKKNEKMLKSLKKKNERNPIFRHVAKTAGKGKKHGLRKLEVEVEEEVAIVLDEDEIGRKITQHNKEHFSKVKSAKAHEDKTCERTNENKTRDIMMNGELKRDECDEEGPCQFLKLLERPKGLTPDEEDYTEVNEWK